MTEYVVGGKHSWNRAIFNDVISNYPGDWTYVDSPDQLETVLTGSKETVDPEYVFFLHWSWVIPEYIHNRYECINFHMMDLPYGRGGSPLQNLILDGKTMTTMTAHRVTDDFDAGPVYARESLHLCGTAESIYVRASHLSADMIEDIIRDHPDPTPQQGEPVEFERRTPDQSELPELDTLDELHDFIRMLDAEGYPSAFLDHEGFRYTLSRSARYEDRVVATVTITDNSEEPK